MLSVVMLSRGARQLKGENLKVVWAEFSTLSWAILLFIAHIMSIYARPCLELKTEPRFCPVN
jgi:hypothetical protein